MNIIKYHTFNVGKSGNGKICMTKGILEYTHEIISPDSNSMAVGVMVVYDSFYRWNVGGDRTYGHGWKIKFSPEYSEESDFYKNRVTVEKNEKGNIVSIKDNNSDSKISFNYTNGDLYLNDISDNKGNFIRVFMGDGISKISRYFIDEYKNRHLQGQTLFKYDGARLTKIIGPSFTGVEMTYYPGTIAGYRVASIKDISCFGVITSSGAYDINNIEIQDIDSVENPISEINKITFDFNSTKINTDNTYYYMNTTTKKDLTTDTEIVYTHNSFPDDFYNYYQALYNFTKSDLILKWIREYQLKEGLYKEEYKINSITKQVITYSRSYDNDSPQEEIISNQGEEDEIYVKAIYDNDTDFNLIEEQQDGYFDKVDNGNIIRLYRKTNHRLEYENKKVIKNIITILIKDSKDSGDLLMSKEYSTFYTYYSNGKILSAKDKNTGIIKKYYYDQNGNAIRTAIYHDSNPNLEISETCEINENGITTDLYDVFRNHTKLSYKDNMGILSSITDSHGNTIDYIIDDKNGELSKISIVSENTENSNNFIYTKKFLTELKSSNNSKINYEYYNKTEDFDSKQVIKIDDIEYINQKIARDENGEQSVVATYTNSDFVEVLADKFGKPQSTKFNGQDFVHYIYDDKDNMISTIDYLTNSVTNYVYDNDGNAISSENEVFAAVTSTDVQGNIISGRLKLKDLDIEQINSYMYDDNNRISDISLSQSDESGQVQVLFSESILYDNLNRLKSISHPKHIDEFHYLTKDNRTSNLIDTVIQGNDTIRYVYDNRGNITEIYINDTLTERYTYDSLNRLIKESNVRLNKAYTYTYDNNGNILYKKDLTTDITKNYTYDKDKLLSYNNQLCTYDLLGNPTIYRSKNLEWSHLKHLRKFGHVSFDYNANGIRTKKSGNSTETKFTYAGDKLLAEKRKTYNHSYLCDNVICSDGIYCYNTDITRMQYLYGVSGITGFILNKNNQQEQTYYYRKNLQGDITHILNTNGEIVGQYIYDAWGNHKVCNPDGSENSSSDFIGNVNSIRYRGYYYDTETKLYYLISRYYDSEVGRFINMDDIRFLKPDTINGLNLYSYCANNPIMHCDPTGQGIIAILTILLVGAIIGGTVAGVVAYNNGKRGWELVGWIILGITVGIAAAGLIIAGVAAIYGGIYGVNALFLGMAAKQVVAIGLLAYNLFVAIVAPLIGISMQTIDFGGNSVEVPNFQPSMPNSGA